MTRESAPLRGAAAIYVYAVILVGGAALTHSLWDLSRLPFQPLWLMLAGLTVGTGWITLRIPSTGISFSISDTFNIAAAVLFGPSAGAITAALDGLVLTSKVRFTRRTAYRPLFNIAVSAIAIWLAAHVFLTLAGGAPLLDGRWAPVRLVGLLAVFAAVNYIVNTGLVAAAVSFERRTPALPLWREHFQGLWVTHFGGVFAVIPLLLLERLQPSIGALNLLVLLVPLPAILYTTFRHAVGRVQDHVAHLGQVNRVYVAVIEALAQAVDAKDEVTHDHIRRVQMHAIRLAHALGVHEEDQLQAIMAASLLHDVGKLSVPEHILNKPGKLTPAEFEIMKRHAPAGADILSVVGFPYPVVPIVRHHHENWDGTGYPDRIAGEQIPIGARILSVVDCFDALTSDRPYRPRLDDRAALQIIVDRRGTMYDPRVVDAFLEMRQADAEDLARGASTQRAESAVPAAPATTRDREMLDLHVFCDLGRSLAAAASVADLGSAVWCHLQSRIPASTMVLYVYDPASDELVAIHAAGDEAGHLQDVRMKIGERLSGWVAAARESIVNSDARLDLDEQARERSTLQAALAVPMEADDRCVGVLSFYSPQSGTFDDAHRRLAQAAGDSVAPSIVSLSSPSSPVRLPRGTRDRLETVQ